MMVQTNIIYVLFLFVKAGNTYILGEEGKPNDTKRPLTI